MTTIETGIVSVTVYLDRARVMRRGAIRLNAGAQTLTIANLPTTLQQDSVRASGKGVGIKIIGVDVKQVFVTSAPETTIAELRQQLEALRDQDQSWVDDDAALQSQIGFLNTLSESTGRSFAKGFTFGNASLERAQQFTDYLVRELNVAQAKRRDLAQKRREQERKIKATQAHLEQVQRVETNARYEINIEVQAAAETNFELEVTYVVNNARWTPLYDLRVTGTDVSLAYLGQVMQSTGENWESVEMFLSTARSATSTEIPELDPWYVDVYRMPVARSAKRAMIPGEAGAMPMPAPAPQAFQAMAEQAAPEPARMLEATIESSGAAVTYRVARPMTAPSDNTPHKTAITTLDLDARLDYITSPKIAEEVYMRAKIKNTSEFVLLAGAVNVFHGDDFVGVTEIETIAPNEEFEAHLGIDERIKVKRELTERVVDKTLIGNTRRMTFGYKITLTNLMATDAKITLLDQVPMPRDEAIKIKMRDSLPKPIEQNDLNILKWELEFKPQEKHEITFGFIVEHPRDVQLTGLNV